MSLNRPIWKLRDWIDIEKLDWNMLSLNPNPKAIELLEENMEKINWYVLSFNKNAIHILERNTEKIDYSNLSLNKNAIKLLFQATR